MVHLPAATVSAKQLVFNFKQFRITGYLSPPSSTACHWSKEFQVTMLFGFDIVMDSWVEHRPLLLLLLLSSMAIRISFAACASYQ